MIFCNSREISITIMNKHLFVHRNAFERVICKMASIWSWPECFNSLTWLRPHNTLCVCCMFSIKRRAIIWTNACHCQLNPQEQNSSELYKEMNLKMSLQMSVTLSKAECIHSQNQGSLHMHPANERWCYTVTPSLIGGAHGHRMIPAKVDLHNKTLKWHLQQNITVRETT